MKRYFFLIYIAPILVLLLVYNCSRSGKSGKIDEKELTGKWRAVQLYGTEIDPAGRVQSIVVFNDNYSVESIYLEKAKQRKDIGTWQLSYEDGNNILYLEFEHEKAKLAASFDGDNLVLNQFDSELPIWKLKKD